MRLSLPFPPPASRYWATMEIGKFKKTVHSRDAKEYIDQARGAYEQELGLQPMSPPSAPLAGALSVAIQAHHPDARERKMTDIMRIVLDALVSAGIIAPKPDAELWDLRVLRSSVQPGGRCVVLIDKFSAATAAAGVDVAPQMG